MSGTVVELHTCNATSLVNQSVDNLIIQGIEEEFAFIVKDVLVMKDIVDVSDSIPTDVLARSYPDLEDTSFKELDNKKVELLLGSRLNKAFLLQEQRVGGL